MPHLWQHRSKQPSHTAFAGGSFFPPMATSDEKRALRERLVHARSALPAAQRASASQAAAEVLESLAAWRGARVVALYFPVGAEVDTAHLAQSALQAGKRVAWPRTRPGEIALEFASCLPPDLIAGALGTRQPPLDAAIVPIGDLDLVVVPGVAFDRDGHRLGRGGGYYDATLALLAKRTVRVGLAFELQLVSAVPCEPHDAQVDGVVTERGLRSESLPLR